MKTKRAVMAATAAVFAGIATFALAGCEWFSFDRNKEKNVSGTLGYEGDAAAWLMSGTSGDSSFLTSSLRTSVAIRTSNGAGSGVVYQLKENEGATSAYVVTNYHVTYGARSFSAYFYGDKYDPNSVSESALSATYVGGSEDEDIAVLAVEVPSEKSDFVLPISSEGGNKVGTRDSDDARVGERVYAIGNLLGNGLSVVSGVVSVQAEYNTFSKVSDSSAPNEMLTMRIDAPVAHGNSGGGLFDGNGKLIGIVNGGMETAKNGDDTIDVDNYGFAIPVNRALSVAQSIIDNCEATGSKKATCARLGTWEIQSSKGVYYPGTQTVDIVEDVVITEVASGSPFAGKDITNKVLRRIVVKDEEGEPCADKLITREHQIKSVLYNVRKGYTVELTFDGGEKIEVPYNADSNFSTK